MKPKQVWVRCAGLAGLFFFVSLACSLSSPTPASWAGTPTALAEAETREAFQLTQQFDMEESGLLERTPFPTLTEVVISTASPTYNATPSSYRGPWLVYPAAESGKIKALDTLTGEKLEIILPSPIYTEDLVRGLSPEGSTFVIRAGSPLNTDEFALYRIDLPDTNPQKITPLLTLSLQRRIVNEEGRLAFETFSAVTRSDSLAWSPNGRFLAFNAALNNDSSDLYVYDMLNNRVERLNGLFTHSASPFWSPGGNWLVSQELTYDVMSDTWRAENVTRIRVPGYDDQNTLYLPRTGSLGEVFVGWINTHNFFSYSFTESGPSILRQTNVETLSEALIYQGNFLQTAFDPVSGMLAFILDEENAKHERMIAGVYLLRTNSPYATLYRAGDWLRLRFEPGGMFVAGGLQGVFLFSSSDEDMFLAGEGDAMLSPNGAWMVAWGIDEETSKGARLYQPPSIRALQTITDIPVDRILWFPDSSGFFLFSEDTLYQLSFPGLKLEEIGQIDLGSGSDHFIWVEMQPE